MREPVRLAGRELLVGISIGIAYADEHDENAADVVRDAHARRSFSAQGHDIAALLERIRALGVRIALDDFGTGYSSLSYLERFRFDTLKVDKSFVDRLLTTHTTGEIVRLIVGLAGALGMDVVAEGVEDAASPGLARIRRCPRARVSVQPARSRSRGIRASGPAIRKRAGRTGLERNGRPASRDARAKQVAGSRSQRCRGGAIRTT